MRIAGPQIVADLEHNLAPNHTLRVADTKRLNVELHNYVKKLKIQ